jgi:hypothetical protein
MSEAVKADDEATCDRCGSRGAYELGDRRVCADCYAVCGSCCLEFGADDLWAVEDEPSAGPEHGGDDA